MLSDTIVIIPARINSTRLPDKPLAIIGDKTMIEHVALRVKNCGIENIYVATDSRAIADKVNAVGVNSIMTASDCFTGTERVYQAWQNLLKNYKFSPGFNHEIKYILNVQGDMPFISPSILRKVIDSLKSSSYDIITPVVKVSKDVAASTSNVKAVVNKNNQALYFSRHAIPYGGTEFLYHVGIYGFRPESLKQFVELKPGRYEEAEKLEQLRALENGMTIGVCYSDEIPISVDTTEDLAKAQEYIKGIS